MSLDLDELLADWQAPDDEPRARIIMGREGQEVVQLRIDLGVLQMVLDNRPDGTRPHGMPSVLEYIRHELATGNDVPVKEWEELAREFLQFSYRRVALSNIADQMMQSSGDAAKARPYIVRALRDIDTCDAILALAQEAGRESSENTQQRPGLVFNRARLRTQLRVVDGDFDEAVEEVVHGREQLESVLGEFGQDDEDRESDAGIEYLKQLEKRVRQQYGIKLTLHEQLESAVDSEDFERAAKIRDELRKRRREVERHFPLLPGTDG